MTDEPRAHDDLSDLLPGSPLFNPRPDPAPTPTPKPNGQQTATQAPRAVVQRLSDVEPEPVTWLWEGRIPYGKITCLQGPPGVGKSTLAYGIAAKVSRGHPTHPDNPPPAEGASDVLILTHEDGLADTVRPRLDAAFGDCDRIHSFRGTLDSEGHLLFPSIVADLDALEETLRKLGAHLLIIDGISGYMGGKTDTHKEKEVRKDLMGLSDLADRTGTAILAISHLNKASGQSAMNRGMGSIAFNAVYRSVLVASKDQNQPDSGTYVLARVKGNLSAEPPALEYRIEEVDVGLLKAIRVAWGGTSSHTADSLLADSIRDDKRPQLNEAKQFCMEELADGPRLAHDMRKTASDSGISWETLNDAKRALGIVSTKEKTAGGKWSWSLPPHLQK